MVHIIKCHDWDNDNPSHHNIHISSTLGDLYISKKKIQRRRKKSNVVNEPRTKKQKLIINNEFFKRMHR